MLGPYWQEPCKFGYLLEQFLLRHYTWKALIFGQGSTELADIVANAINPQYRGSDNCRCGRQQTLNSKLTAIFYVAIHSSIGFMARCAEFHSPWTILCEPIRNCAWHIIHKTTIYDSTATWLPCIHCFWTRRSPTVCSFPRLFVLRSSKTCSI